MFSFRKIQPYLLLLTLLVGLFLYFNGAFVQKIPGVDFFKPKFYTEPRFGDAPVLAIDWDKVLMGSEQNGAAIQRLSLRLDQIEREKSWGRVGLANQGSYYSEMRSIAEHSIHQVSRMIARTYGRSLARFGEENLEKNEDLEVFRTPGAIAAGLAAVYTGRMVRYSLTNDIQLGSSTQIEQNRFQGQRIHLITPWVNAMLAYTTVTSAGYNGHDQMQASISKDFQDIGLRANVVYGNASGATSYSISKSITPELSVSYDETRGSVAGLKNRSIGVGYSHGF
jgi:hypothetical protein